MITVMLVITAAAAEEEEVTISTLNGMNMLLNHKNKHSPQCHPRRHPASTTTITAETETEADEEVCCTDCGRLAVVCAPVIVTRRQDRSTTVEVDECVAVAAVRRHNVRGTTVRGVGGASAGAGRSGSSYVSGGRIGSFTLRTRRRTSYSCCYLRHTWCSYASSVPSTLR